MSIRHDRPTPVKATNIEKTSTDRLHFVLQAGMSLETGVHLKPKIVQRTPYIDVYLLNNRELQEKYLRYSAVGRFYNQSLDRFNEQAAAGVYGPVSNGDWEGAGIKVEDSTHVRVSKRIYEPIQNEWNKIMARWGLEEADDVDFVTRREAYDEFEDRFTENYDEIFGELYVQLGLNKAEFTNALDEFVGKMMEN